MRRRTDKQNINKARFMEAAMRDYLKKFGPDRAFRATMKAVARRYDEETSAGKSFKTDVSSFTPSQKPNENSGSYYDRLVEIYKETFGLGNIDFEEFRSQVEADPVSVEDQKVDREKMNRDRVKRACNTTFDPVSGDSYTTGSWWASSTTAKVEKTITEKLKTEKEIMIEYRARIEKKYGSNHPAMKLTFEQLCKMTGCKF